MDYTTKIKDLIGFEHTFDFNERIIKGSNNYSFSLLFNTFLTDSLKMTILTSSFIEIKDRINEKNFIDIVSNYFSGESLSINENPQEVANKIFNGDLAIMMNNHEYAFVIDVKKYPSRSLSEPDSEKVVRGSRDGFTENVSSNIALIRRRIKDNHLIMKQYEIGKVSKTKVVLLYLEDIIDNKIKKNIEEKLDTLKVNELTLTDKALEELLLDNSYTPYPLIKYTERPDTLAMHLYQGMFGIIVDTSPSAIIGPVSVFDHLQHAEEFRQTVIAGTYLRIIRFLGIVFSFFSVPLWLALSSANYQIPFLSFLFLTDIDFNHLFFQVLLSELAVELIRMASIHTPSALSTSMGLISGLILGDMAVKVGIVKEQIVILAAISAIGSYITPSYELSLASKISKLFMIFMVFLFKIPGLIISTLIVIIYLACLKSFTRPYLYPLIPFNIKDFLKQMIRIPYKKKAKVSKR